MPHPSTRQALAETPLIQPQEAPEQTPTPDKEVKMTELAEEGKASEEEAAGTEEEGEVPEEPTPAPDVPAGPVVIALKDFSLNPDSITVKAGNIVFVLKNEGRYTHDFRVEGQGIDEKSPRVSAGRERQWEMTLQPGEYRISCPISNHDERGMVGTLVVTE
jgi:plastocyanin